MKKNNSPNDKINIEEMKRAANSGKIDEYIKQNMGDDMSKRLNSILSDEKKTKELLSSPKAKELFKKFGGDK